LTLPGRPITNAVEEAVFLVFGGFQGAAAALGVGAPTIHAALKAGCVRTKANAERWEEATTQHGCTIPREELIGWGPWRGPERHNPTTDDDGPTNGRSRRPKAARRPLASVASSHAHVAPAPAQTGTKGGAATDPPALHALRALGIVRTPGVPARLLEAHAQLERPAETTHAPSAPVSRCSVESTSLISQGATAAAAVGNRKASSAAVSPCSPVPKRLIFQARGVHNPAFRRAA
jgi:hypothetical protein